MTDRSGVLATLVLCMSLAGSLPATAQEVSRPGPALRPADLRWIPNPGVPPGSELALLSGAPASSGMYTLRVRFPMDHRVMPHSHPDERTYTVLHGTFHIGFGSAFDPDRLTAWPPGSFVVVPANQPHFQWARTDTVVVQISGLGPTALVYLDPAHDPRRP